MEPLYSIDSLSRLLPIDAVRWRPAVWLGSKGVAGLSSYLASIIALVLSHHPTRVDIVHDDASFILHTDIAIPLEEASDGTVIPFEGFVDNGVAGVVVTGLSETLEVTIGRTDSAVRLYFEKGARMAYDTFASATDAPFTTLAFTPDATVFSATILPPTTIQSYLRRLSYLNQGVRFTFTASGQTTVYHTEDAVEDLFQVIAIPCQLLHDPVRIVAEAGDLRLQMVFAYHAGQEDILCTSINREQAADGGTHEIGLRQALKELPDLLCLPPISWNSPYRIVGAVSILYPRAVWNLRSRSRIENPELADAVYRLVRESVVKWGKERPDDALQLRQLSPSLFSDIWSPRGTFGGGATP